MSAIWRDQFAEKVTTAGAAIRKIRSGDRVYISSGCGEPEALIRALLANGSSLADVELLHLLSLGAAAYTQEPHTSIFRPNAFWVGDNVSKAIRENRADHIPILISQVPALMRDRSLSIDVALIAVSLPDDHGYCSLGLSVDITKAAAECARLVIAEVNANMPRTLGNTFLHVSQIHHLVESDEPLLQWTAKRQKPDENVQAIATHVAQLIDNSTTLQTGIGSISEGVLSKLTDKHDLAIHSHFITDGMMKLARAGVITGSSWPHPRQIVGSTVVGTQELFRFVDGNPQVQIYPSDYIGDPLIISRQPNMVSISEAHEVDLTGQSGVDPLNQVSDDNFGAEEFVRQAARAENGKVIIAMPSTALGKEGIRSRIVPSLTSNLSVFAGRTDVQYVVTEYGIAYLHGKSVRERAMSLIRIAHPDFRSELLHVAKQRRYVYANQIMPPLFRPYPEKYEAKVKLKDNSEVFIRPIRPDDEPLMKEMFYSFSEQTVYLRYHGILKSMPHNRLQLFCNIDYDTEMALVATTGAPGREEVVAVGRFMADPSKRNAELAFVVRDDWQRKGLGSELFHRLIDIGRGTGIHRFHADVLIANSGMLKIFHHSGLQIHTTTDPYTVRVTMSLPEEQNT